MKYFLHMYCLEDNFSGHYYPDVAIPISSDMTISEIKENLKEVILKHWDSYVYPEAMLEAAENLTTQHSMDYKLFQDFEGPEGAKAIFLGIPTS